MCSGLSCCNSIPMPSRGTRRGSPTDFVMYAVGCCFSSIIISPCGGTCSTESMANTIGYCLRTLGSWITRGSRVRVGLLEVPNTMVAGKPCFTHSTLQDRASAFMELQYNKCCLTSYISFDTLPFRRICAATMFGLQKRIPNDCPWLRQRHGESVRR